MVKCFHFKMSLIVIIYNKFLTEHVHKYCPQIVQTSAVYGSFGTEA